MLTRSGDVGKYASAEEIISAISSIDSLPITYGVIESLPIDSIDTLIDGDSIIECDMIGVIIVGRRNSQNDVD
jgi:hypothetical protein